MMIGTTSRRARSWRATSWPDGGGPSATSSSTMSYCSAPARSSAACPSGTAVIRWPSALDRALEVLAQRLGVVDEQDVQRCRRLHRSQTVPLRRVPGVPAIRLHDTRSGTLQELRPRPDGTVGIYACGPTVYNRIHVGNARPFVTY